MQATSEDLRGSLIELSRRVSRALGVPCRPIDVEIVSIPYYASSAISWPPERAHMRVSRDHMSLGILGHEITHCLVPTRWLFFAEGFATWMGCEIAGNCADFCFSENDIDDVVRTSCRLGRYTSIGVFIRETSDRRIYFSPSQMHELRVRLAHVCAASFLRWFCGLHPRLPVVVAAEGCGCPVDRMTLMARQDIVALEAAWIDALQLG